MNCLNSFQHNIVSNISSGFSVTFDIPEDLQFFKKTTQVNDLSYDVYTIVGQDISGVTTSSVATNKKVVATFKAKNVTKTIYYVCVGGGGYSYVGTRSVCGGGGGGGAFYEGSIDISTDVIFNLEAGGAYKTSSITSSIKNVTAGNGGYSGYRLNVNNTVVGSGINGSSGGGANALRGAIGNSGAGSSPGNSGGMGNYTATGSSGTYDPKSSGGGGGAGGVGGNGTTGSPYNGGAGGIGKSPSVTAISNIYTSKLCVGGSGIGSWNGNVSRSNTYGSGGHGVFSNSSYINGQPGAIIIAIPNAT